MSSDEEEAADRAAARRARASIEAGEPLIPWEQVKGEAAELQELYRRAVGEDGTGMPAGDGG